MQEVNFFREKSTKILTALEQESQPFTINERYDQGGVYTVSVPLAQLAEHIRIAPELSTDSMTLHRFTEMIAHVIQQIAKKIIFHNIDRSDGEGAQENENIVEFKFSTQKQLSDLQLLYTVLTLYTDEQLSNGSLTLSWTHDDSLIFDVYTTATDAQVSIPVVLQLMQEFNSRREELTILLSIVLAGMAISTLNGTDEHIGSAEQIAINWCNALGLFGYDYNSDDESDGSEERR